VVDTDPLSSHIFYIRSLAVSAVLSTVFAPLCIRITAFTNHSSIHTFLRAHLVSFLAILLNAFRAYFLQRIVNIIFIP